MTDSLVSRQETRKFLTDNDIHWKLSYSPTKKHHIIKKPYFIGITSTAHRAMADKLITITRGTPYKITVVSSENIYKPWPKDSYFSVNFIIRKVTE